MQKKSGCGFRGLSEYLLRNGRGQIVAGPVAGRSARELSHEFGLLRRLNPKLRQAVVHFSISPAPGDPAFTDSQWQALAERFMCDLGYADAPWVGVIHRDTDHVHLHVMGCRIDYQGKTVSNFNDFPRAEAIMRRVEADYGLRALTSSRELRDKAKPCKPHKVAKSRKTAPRPIDKPSGDNAMNDTAQTPANPFDPSDPQHATWPQPSEPGRDLAELAIVNTSPSIMMPSAGVAEPLTKKQAQAMRRSLVEEDYPQRMLTVLGDDLTRVFRHNGGVTLYFKQPGRIADQGDKLTVLGGMDEKLAARRIVAMGRERGWKSITFTGSASFLELAMREALKERLTVVTNDARQAAILAKVMAERQGDMGTVAGPAPMPPGAVPADEDILSLLSELDDLSPQPWPMPPKPAQSTQPVAAPPAAPVMPEVPKSPQVGTMPRFLNLRERLQDRREQHAPTGPGKATSPPAKRPGL